jgi:hypothetical protein
MTTTDDLTLDCRTCVAANTTACEDCIVQHLLANDAGPIEFVPSAVPEPADGTEWALAMFVRAGMVDPESPFVSMAEFRSVDVPQTIA